MAAYFPVALRLEGRRCLVVGGGPIAARKLDPLIEAGARVVVVAARSSPALEEQARARDFELRRRPFEPGDLDGIFLAVVATDNGLVNRQVVDEARRRGILVNVADDPSQCDVIMPAVVRRGAVQIAITTGGLSPALSRHLRQRLDMVVPPEYGPLAEALALVREELRQEGATIAAESWQAAITDEVLAAIRGGDLEGATDSVRSHLRLRLVEGESRPRDEPLGPGAGPSADLRRGTANAPLSASGRIGHIALVGAGPGDPALLTIAGDQAIAEADVIVYDRLINPTLLERAKNGARLIYAGKHPGGGPMSQEEINGLVCTEARAGHVVVRLKGGDPFVFGRGGEEAVAAARAGVPFSVIPGVTAATAAPAYAGIPVTHRGMASTLTVLTGHEDPNKPSGAVDWDALARLGGTLVLLMGVDTLPAICARLAQGGLPPDTPAASIQHATTADQRVVTGSLADIADRVRAAGIGAPATTVIGEVVALAEELRWWGGSNPSPCGVDSPDPPPL